MSLFGSLQMAGNTLQAMQIGLHVVGNNIANANTPGYIRERAIYSPAPVQKLGDLALGLGVEVDGIVQIIDKFVENRLRDAGSDLASAEALEDAYTKLEAEFNALGDGSIGSMLTSFFNGIDRMLPGPRESRYSRSGDQRWHQAGPSLQLARPQRRTTCIPT